MPVVPVCACPVCLSSCLSPCPVPPCSVPVQSLSLSIEAPSWDHQLPASLHSCRSTRSRTSLDHLTSRPSLPSHQGSVWVGLLDGFPAATLLLAHPPRPTATLRLFSSSFLSSLSSAISSKPCPNGLRTLPFPPARQPISLGHPIHRCRPPPGSPAHHGMAWRLPSSNAELAPLCSVSSLSASLAGLC